MSVKAAGLDPKISGVAPTTVTQALMQPVTAEDRAAWTGPARLWIATRTGDPELCKELLSAHPEWAIQALQPWEVAKLGSNPEMLDLYAQALKRLPAEALSLAGRADAGSPTVSLASGIQYAQVGLTETCGPKEPMITVTCGSGTVTLSSCRNYVSFNTNILLSTYTDWQVQDVCWHGKHCLVLGNNKLSLYCLPNVCKRQAARVTAPQCVTLHGNYYAVGNRQGEIQVGEVINQETKTKQTLELTGRSITALAMNDRYLVAGHKKDDEYQLTRWEIPTGSAPWRSISWATEVAEVTSLVIDGDSVLVGGTKPGIEIWNLADAQKLGTIAHPHPVTRLELKDQHVNVVTTHTKPLGPYQTRATEERTVTKYAKQ